MILLWICSFLIILRVYCWFDIQLIPDENVCLVTTQSARGLLWRTMSIYTLPMSVINIVYLQMNKYLKERPMIVSTDMKRDVLVIHRIVLVLIVLSIIGTPTIISMLMLPFTKVGESLLYRISSMTMSFSVVTFIFMGFFPSA